jgi:hypothetical protein
MDEMKRKQTTLGIWASYSANTNMIVLDVEGTDGRERGDSQVSIYIYICIYV